MTRVFFLSLWCVAWASVDRPLADLTLPFVSLVDGVVSRLRTGQNVSVACQGEVSALLRAATAAQDWATRMVDSMGRPGNGMAGGGLKLIGSFSECVDVVAEVNGTTVGGQYCLADFRSTSSVKPDSLPTSVWKLLVNQTLELAFCLPWSCTANDLASVLDDGVEEAFPNCSLSGQVKTCHLRDTTFSPSPASVSVIVILSVILVLAIAGTLFDVLHTCKRKGLLCAASSTLDNSAFMTSTEQLCPVHNKKEAAWAKVLVAFSLHENGRRILQVGGEGEGSSMAIFHGMRFLSMVWIIFGHSVSFAFMWISFRNPNQMVGAPSDFGSQIFANGTFSVDTFFYLSGFLVTFCSMKVLKKTGGKMNVPMFIIHRYIRMTPLMMLIIAFCATLLKHVGSGPTWLSTIAMYDVWCQKNWWINALYLQNFIDTPNMCLSHSWYSAVDMQFFIISPLFLLLLYKSRTVGLAALLGTLLLSFGVTAYISAANHYPPIPFVGNVVPPELVDDYSSHLYIKPYCRIGPYIVGLAMGYLVHGSQGTITLKKKYVVMGWILAATAQLSVLYAMWPAYEGYPVSNAGAAVYSAIARTVWALGLSWITFACITGNGGFVSTFLSWKAFVPLSRLTYCAYLIHPVVMAAFYGSREMTFDFSLYLMVYFIIGNLVISYFGSFILSMFCESPFIALERVFIRKT